MMRLNSSSASANLACCIASTPARKIRSASESPEEHQVRHRMASAVAASSRSSPFSASSASFSDVGYISELNPFHVQSSKFKVGSQETCDSGDRRSPLPVSVVNLYFRAL